MSIDYKHKNNDEGGDPLIPTILTCAALVNTNIRLHQVIQCEDLLLATVQVKQVTFQILFQGKAQRRLAVRTL